MMFEFCANLLHGRGLFGLQLELMPELGDGGFSFFQGRLLIITSRPPQQN